MAAGVTERYLDSYYTLLLRFLGRQLSRRNIFFVPLIMSDGVWTHNPEERESHSIDRSFVDHAGFQHFSYFLWWRTISGPTSTSSATSRSWRLFSCSRSAQRNDSTGRGTARSGNSSNSLERVHRDDQLNAFWSARWSNYGPGRSILLVRAWAPSSHVPIGSFN
jgi:hypothetical protein